MRGVFKELVTNWQSWSQRDTDPWSLPPAWKQVKEGLSSRPSLHPSTASMWVRPGQAQAYIGVLTFLAEPSWLTLSSIQLTDTCSSRQRSGEQGWTLPSGSPASMSRVRPSRGGRWGGSLEQEEDPGRFSLISEDRFPRE